jgi:hypothetical protein
VIRTLLVAICVLCLLLAVLGLRRGWRNRLARQSDLPPLASVPAELGRPLLRSSGLYVGSTFASSWQDRVVHGGLGERADAVATLYAEGVLVERQGAAAIFVPRAAWVGARLAPGLAGKVMGEGGLLVLRWRLGQTQVDSGLRADDKTSYPTWVNTINARVAA